MTTEHDDTPGAAATEGAPQNGAANGAANGAEHKPAPPSEVETLRQEKQELFDRLQRVSAEFQNFQKRTQRDRAQWQKDAARDVVNGFFSVVDSLDLATEAFEKPNPDPAALKKGVELVRDELRRKLEANGVVAMNVPPGTPFDPDRHQAVMFEPADVEKEVVGAVFRSGWLVGDQVLRPAQVVVKKPK